MANIIFYVGPTDQTLYLRIQNPAGDYVATALTEGGTGADGTYGVSEATIAALSGMSSASTGNGCAYTVRVGSASTTAEDPISASGFLLWSGSTELSTAIEPFTGGALLLQTVMLGLQGSIGTEQIVLPVGAQNEGAYANCIAIITCGNFQDRRTILDSSYGFTDDFGDQVILELDANNENPSFGYGDQTEPTYVEIIEPGFRPDDRISLQYVETKVNGLLGLVGCSSVLEVGTNKQFATINDAEASAVAGTLIMVYDGSYTEVIGKDNVTYYLAKDVSLQPPQNYDLIANGVTNTRILGHGTLSTAASTIDKGLFTSSSSGQDITIEADKIIITADCWGIKSTTSDSDSKIIVRTSRLVMDNHAVVAASTGGARIHVEVQRATTANRCKMVSINGGGTVELNGIIDYSSSQEFMDSTSTGGLLLIDGYLALTYSSSIGLYTPSTVTTVAVNGGLSTPSGRPSLSGAGPFLISPSFAYDVTRVTATSVIPTIGGSHAVTGGPTFVRGTVISGTLTSFVGTAATGFSLSSSDNFYYKSAVTFTSGALRGQTRKIQSYDGSSGTFTLAASLPSTPGAGTEFVLMGRFE